MMSANIFLVLVLINIFLAWCHAQQIFSAVENQTNNTANEPFLNLGNVLNNTPVSIPVDTSNSNVRRNDWWAVHEQQVTPSSLYTTETQQTLPTYYISGNTSVK